MINISNLSVKYYNPNKTVLDNISLSIRDGEIVSVLGISGSGKTTFLNTIGGIIKHGVDIEMKGSVEFKKKEINIHVVFQDPTLLPWRNVFDNISYGLEIKKIAQKQIMKSVNGIIGLVNLKGNENYYPHQLSLGMQQRVNFARALVCEPDILLLDEPFSSLDSRTKEKIQVEFLKIIKEKNITCIFVTHNLKEAFNMSDRIIVFTNDTGKIKTIIDNKDKKCYLQNLDYLDLYS